MVYQKPEVVLLGPATELILGSKRSHINEPVPFHFGIPDSELDD